MCRLRLLRTVVSHHALARHELEKAVACEAHAASRHALARYEVEKAMGCEARVVSRHALDRCKPEKAMACGGEDLGKNVASLEYGHHKLVNIPPRPQ
jgi:hypothetical protein